MQRSEKEWEADLRFGIGELVDQAVNAGAGLMQAIEVVAHQAAEMRKVWEDYHDPDGD